MKVPVILHNFHSYHFHFFHLWPFLYGPKWWEVLLLLTIFWQSSLLQPGSKEKQWSLGFTNFFMDETSKLVEEVEEVEGWRRSYIFQNISPDFSAASYIFCICSGVPPHNICETSSGHNICNTSSSLKWG